MVTRGGLGAAGGAANGPQRGARRREQASCGSGGATIGEEKARSEQWSASTAIAPKHSPQSFGEIERERWRL